MKWLKQFLKNLWDPWSLPVDPSYQNPHWIWAYVWFSILALLAYALMIGIDPSLAASLPGEDASGKLEAAGTLLRILDTALFKWGARIFAGLCIMSAAWSLKEQRFGIAIICVVGAIVFGTAPKWVKNIFDIGDNQSIFSMNEHSLVSAPVLVASARQEEAMSGVISRA